MIMSCITVAPLCDISLSNNHAEKLPIPISGSRSQFHVEHPVIGY